MTALDVLQIAAACFSGCIAAATLLVTAVGWVYTANREDRLASKQRGHSVVDRELEEFRKRGTAFVEKVRQLGDDLIDICASMASVYKHQDDLRDNEYFKTERSKAVDRLLQARGRVLGLSADPDYYFFRSKVEDKAKLDAPLTTLRAAAAQAMMVPEEESPPAGTIDALKALANAGADAAQDLAGLYGETDAKMAAR